MLDRIQAGPLAAQGAGMNRHGIFLCGGSGRMLRPYDVSLPRGAGPRSVCILVDFCIVETVYDGGTAARMQLRDLPGQGGMTSKLLAGPRVSSVVKFGRAWMCLDSSVLLHTPLFLATCPSPASCLRRRSTYYIKSAVFVLVTTMAIGVLTTY